MSKVLDLLTPPLVEGQSEKLGSVAFLTEILDNQPKSQADHEMFGKNLSKGINNIEAIQKLLEQLENKLQRVRQDSPRFIRAREKLGIEEKELQIKPFEEFKKNHKQPAYQRLYFVNHLQHLEQMLLDVLRERRRIRLEERAMMAMGNNTESSFEDSWLQTRLTQGVDKRISYVLNKSKKTLNVESNKIAIQIENDLNHEQEVERQQSKIEKVEENRLKQQLKIEKKQLDKKERFARSLERVHDQQKEREKKFFTRFKDYQRSIGDKPKAVLDAQARKQEELQKRVEAEKRRKERARQLYIQHQFENEMEYEEFCRYIEDKDENTLKHILHEREKLINKLSDQAVKYENRKDHCLEVIKQQNEEAIQKYIQKIVHHKDKKHEMEEKKKKQEEEKVEREKETFKCAQERLQRIHEDKQEKIKSYRQKIREEEERIKRFEEERRQMWEMKAYERSLKQTQNLINHDKNLTDYNHKCNLIMAKNRRTKWKKEQKDKEHEEVRNKQMQQTLQFWQKKNELDSLYQTISKKFYPRTSTNHTSRSTLATRGALDEKRSQLSNKGSETAKSLSHVQSLKTDIYSMLKKNPDELSGMVLGNLSTKGLKSPQRIVMQRTTTLSQVIKRAGEDNNTPLKSPFSQHQQYQN